MQDGRNFADRFLVSAVIPTRGRPDLLFCAVRSALRQTWRHLEVIVVLDGHDAETEARLTVLPDSRLRILILPEPSGGSIARNAGVRAARGEWIAFLDDDDEWLPDKIERQMRAVRGTSAWFPVVSCRLIARSPVASRVLPLRVYDSSQPIADYLFCRDGLADPGGLLQTSTLLASRELLLAIPFQDGLPMHQDWDWIIRVAAHQGVSIIMLPKPLSIWRVDDTRATVSRGCDWQFSLAWIRYIRTLISGRAFSSFVAIQCVWRARASHASLRGRLAILYAFLFEGRPDGRSLFHFLVFGLMPGRLRAVLRDRFRRSAKSPAAMPGLSLAWTHKPGHAALHKSSL